MATFATPAIASTTPIEVPKIVQVDPLSVNCYAYIKSLIPTLPRTSEIIPNSIYPTVLGVVILDYDGLPHYAQILEVKEDGIEIRESNYSHGKYTQRFLSWSNLMDHEAQYWRE